MPLRERSSCSPCAKVQWMPLGQPPRAKSPHSTVLNLLKGATSPGSAGCGRPDIGLHNSRSPIKSLQAGSSDARLCCNVQPTKKIVSRKVVAVSCLDAFKQPGPLVTHAY